MPLVLKHFVILQQVAALTLILVWALVEVFAWTCFYLVHRFMTCFKLSVHAFELHDVEESNLFVFVVIGDYSKANIVCLQGRGRVMDLLFSDLVWQRSSLDYTGKLVGLMQIVSPSSPLWGSSLLWKMQYQSYAIPSKDKENYFKRWVPFFTIVLHWHLNLLICFKGSVCSLYITNVVRRYPSGKDGM